MVGVAGLLATLALTVSGCQVAPNPGGPDSVPLATQKVEQNKVSDFDPSKTRADAGWEALVGSDPATKAAAARDALALLSIMNDQFPQYTVYGFVPTSADWNEVSSKLQPLVTDSAFQYMESQWNEKLGLPALTSYRTELDVEGVHGYTYTTPTGEKCTDSDQPYTVDMEDLNLTALPATDGTGNLPVIEGSVNLTIHCKEGIKLEGQMKTYFPVEKVGDKWLMKNGYDTNPASAFTVAEKF